MSITSKQKKLLIGFGIFAYLYFFWTYNIANSIPGIKDYTEKRNVAKVELKNLQNELSNIEAKKMELDSIKTANEVYGNYISEEFDILDAMDYAQQLENVFRDKIKGVSITQPRSTSKKTPNVYEIGLNFNSTLKYPELLNLINFIESGRKKVTINNLSVVPFVDKKTNTSNEKVLPSIYQPDLDLNISISMSIYALSLDSAEKIFEMTKNKFEKFGYFDGIAFNVPMDLGGNVTNINFGGQGVKPLPPISRRTDMKIRMDSFLSGLPNFLVKGINSGEFINVMTRERQKITLRMNNYTYSLESVSSSGKRKTFSGNTLQRETIIYIEETVPDIIENQNLAMDIQIINESDYEIGIRMNKKSKRVKIFDRNMSQVRSTSQADKIFFI